LKDGHVRPRSFEFDFEEVPVLVDGFRRMVRGPGVRRLRDGADDLHLRRATTASASPPLPIFLVRRLSPGRIRVNTRPASARPKDLEGPPRGVNRGYTVTHRASGPAASCSRRHGVDLSKVTWVLSGRRARRRVPGRPRTVVPIEKGRRWPTLLIAGELAAAIGVDVEHPDVQPLIADADEAG
jgi:4,5-dihydroxyphthalate decarboxylase